MHVEVVLVSKEAAFLEDEKSTTLRVRSSGSASADIIRELWEDHAEAEKNLYK